MQNHPRFGPALFAQWQIPRFSVHTRSNQREDASADGAGRKRCTNVCFGIELRLARRARSGAAG